jgi:transcription initiation factor TFIIB
MELETIDENTAWRLLNDFHLNDDENEVEDVHVCSHCHSANIIVENSTYICSNCNAMQGRYIDQSAEWRTFSGTENAKQKDPSRCGMPINDLLPEGSMSTFVGMSSNSKNYRDLSRISKYQMWNAMPYKERSLYHAIDQLTVKAVNNGISQSIIDDAKVLYKKLTDSCISRGENRCGLLASSIYVACKNNKVPRSAKEIAAMFGIDSNIITRNCKKFQELMHMRLCSSSPSDFVMRFCSHLKIPSDIQSACLNMVSTIHEHDMMRGSSPPSIVAGCITFLLHHMETNANISKKEVAKVCGVSEVTISKCIKKLETIVKFK